MAAKFEQGKHYYTRSACQHDCIFAYTIERRTAKSAVIVGKDGKSQRKKIYDMGDGIERISLGSYSMAPVLTADRELCGEGTLQERVDAMHRADMDATRQEQTRLRIGQNFKMFLERVGA